MEDLEAFRLKHIDCKKGYTCKLIVAGDTYTLKEFDNLIWKGFKSPNAGRKELKRVLDETDLEEVDLTAGTTKVENRRVSMFRRMKKIRTMINSNPDCDRFITLTFAEDVRNIDKANRCLRSSMKEWSITLKNIVGLIT